MTTSEINSLYRLRLLNCLIEWLICPRLYKLLVKSDKITNKDKIAFQKGNISIDDLVLKLKKYHLTDNQVKPSSNHK